MNEAASIKTVALMYHDVVGSAERHVESGFDTGGAALYKLTVEQFAAHLAAIKERGGDAKCVGELNDATGLRGKHTLLLTFDDGGVSAYHPIAPMLEAYGWRGHFFVTTDRIGTHGFLDARQIKNLHERGHVIGSHSCSHPQRMSSVSDAQLRREWRQSVATLSEIVEKTLDVASVPGGFYARRVGEAAAESGIKRLFTSEPVRAVKSVRGCLVFGRYSIQQWTPPERAAALAAGDFAPRAGQFMLWNAKKVLKNLGGELYLKIQRALIERGRASSGS